METIPATPSPGQSAIRGAGARRERPAMTAVGREIREHLERRPRQLPSYYLYDALGSSLFDAICHLPWYGVTRAEMRLLGAHAPDIGRAFDRRPRLIELGCGNGDKLRMLVEGLGLPDVHVDLIDFSPTALARCAQRLGELPGVTVDAVEATYEEGLERLPARRRADANRRALAAFLGSNIGNFEPAHARSLLGRVRAALCPGDWLLLGVDLVKPAPALLLAYDDPLGVTAAFNRNLLSRLNAEFHADFDLARFGHRAIWNEAAARIEMHLVSRRRQRVDLRALDLQLTLASGETIWTESSYKYRPAEVTALVEPIGFRQREQWIDQGDRFELVLFEAT